MIDSNLMKNIEAACTHAIKKEIEKEVAAAVEEAKKRLDRRIPEIVAGLSINLMRNVQMRSLHDELLISIRMPEKKGVEPT